MKKRTVKLTPSLIKRLIQEEKAKILKEQIEKKKNKKRSNKLIVETIRKFLLINKAQKRDVKVAMSNTFGFGGHNACVVFKKLD